MDFQSNYEVFEEENRVIIKMTQAQKMIRSMLYYVMFASDAIVLFILIFTLSRITEIMPIILIAVFFSFLGLFFLLRDIIPEEVIIEPERLVLNSNWYILGRRKSVIYRWNIKRLSMRKIFVKGSTRVEVFAVLSDKKKNILRFNYTSTNKEYIENIYKKIAEKLNVEYDAFQL